MKIDKRSPSHWISLITFGINCFVGLVIRPFLKKKSIVLYGHKLNGNLLQIYRQAPQAIFLTMDKAYIKELKEKKVRCQWACSPRTATLLASAKAIISDHGLHSLEPLVSAYRKQGLKLFDVWHGIPFKGFDEQDFKLQQQYDEVWVASPLQKDLYTKHYGFSEEKVVITGYARTDVLIDKRADAQSLKRQLNLPSSGPLILFAPTWAQDNEGRSVFPFGHDASAFLEALSGVAKQFNATILLRTHINTSGENLALPSRVIALPGNQFPDTESILNVSDILICDWSSVAFDFLLLDRPTLFLDVPAPFQKGFSLGPDYRFGPVIKDLGDLKKTLHQTMKDTQLYWKKNLEKHNKIKQAVYSGWADGKATSRCLNRLSIHSDTKGESFQ